MKVVVFQVGDHVYGVDAATVREIIDPVPVTPLPFVSPEIEGLINVAGKIYLQLCLLLRLKRAYPSCPDGGSVIILTTERGLCACRITKIIDRIDVEEATVSPPPAAEYGGDMVAIGLFYREGLPVLLLDPDHLLLPQKCKDVVDSPSPAPALNMPENELPQPEVLFPPNFPCVVFTCDNKLYAFRFDDVVEVVENEELMPIPYTAPEPVSVALLRGKPLPLLDTQSLLVGTAQKSVHFTLVVRLDGHLAGLQVEQVVGLQRVTFDSLLLPAITKDLIEGGAVTQEGVPVALINYAALELLAYAEPLRRWFMTNREQLAGNGAESLPTVVKKRMVLFRLGEELMALPLAEVERIEEYFEPTETPGGESSAISGVIQVRGNIMPVRSIEKRLGRTCDRQPGAYLVVASAGSFCAVPVRKVVRVVDIDLSTIILANSGRNSLVSGTGHYNGIPVKFIDGEELAA